jgi:hypothetical protein
MRRLLHWAVRLYPARWRRRYGQELEALLEDAGPQWRDFWDVTRGAIEMQIKTGRLLTLAAFGLAGAIAGAVVAHQFENRYVSTTILQLKTPAGQNLDAAAMASWLDRARQQVLSRSSLAAVITSPALELYPAERRSQPLEEIIHSMLARDIQIQSLRNSQLPNSFAVRFIYSDPEKARSVASDLVARMMRANVVQSKVVHPPSEPPLTLVVLDPANLSNRPLYPNRPAFVGLGFLGGLLLGASLHVFGITFRSGPVER